MPHGSQSSSPVNIGSNNRGSYYWPIYFYSIQGEDYKVLCRSINTLNGSSASWAYLFLFCVFLVVRTEQQGKIWPTHPRLKGELYLRDNRIPYQLIDHPSKRSSFDRESWTHVYWVHDHNYIYTKKLCTIINIV